MPTPFDLSAFNTEFDASKAQAQSRHDATGTGERLTDNLKEGLWNLQGSMAGLVGAGQTRADALASEQLSQEQRGASADTGLEQAVGSAIQSTPITLASFLPAGVLRFPAARLAAGRALAQATRSGLSASEAMAMARVAGEEAAGQASRIGMGGGMGALSAPDAYDDAINAGADPRTALANAVGAAFTEGAATYLSPGGTEAAMLTRPTLQGGIVKAITSVGKEAAHHVASEATEEALTEAAHIERERALGINSGGLLDEANLKRLGLSAAAGGIMGPSFNVPGMAVDLAKGGKESLAQAILSSRLATAPTVDPAAMVPSEIPTTGSESAPIEQAITAAAIRSGRIPQDFTPDPRAVYPVTGGALPEAQPGGMTADNAAAQLAQQFASMPPEVQHQAVASLFQAPAVPEVPRVEAATPIPAPVAAGVVPGSTPAPAGNTPSPAIAPQRSVAAAAPVGLSAPNATPVVSGETAINARQTDAHDFNQAVAETGMTPEQYSEVSSDMRDVVPQPVGDPLAVGPSAIHGAGVLATAEAKPGAVLGTALDAENHRTTAGRFVNHAADANADLVEQDDGTAALVAKRAVKPGDEVTIDYRQAHQVIRQRQAAMKPAAGVKESLTVGAPAYEDSSVAASRQEKPDSAATIKPDLQVAPLSSSSVKDSLTTGQRVRYAKGKKAGTEATIAGVVNGRPVLRTDDGKIYGEKTGIDPAILAVVHGQPQVATNDKSAPQAGEVGSRTQATPVPTADKPASSSVATKRDPVEKTEVVKHSSQPATVPQLPPLEESPVRGDQNGRADQSASGASPEVGTRQNVPEAKTTEAQAAEQWRGMSYAQREETAGRSGIDYRAAKDLAAVGWSRMSPEHRAKLMTAMQKDHVPSATNMAGGDHSEDSLGKVKTASAEPRVNPVAERLRKSAITMAEKADQELGRERQSNTRRRADMAASAIRDASQRKADATTAQNLADALERGEVQHVAGVKSLADVVSLRRQLDNAVHAVRQDSPDRMKWTDNHSRIDTSNPTDDEIRSGIKGNGAIEMSVHGEWVRKALEDAKGSRGLPAVRHVLGSYIGERFHAATTDQIDALRELSGMSKLWGDNIKRALETPMRLRAMGITTKEQLRDALVEFNHLRAAVPGENKSSKLERDIRFQKIPGFFPTPPKLAEEVVRKADIKPGMKVLEPEGGKGDLAQRVRDAGATVEVAETQSSLRDILEAKGFTLVGHDMMEIQPPADGPVYDRIVMNPPFENGQDREHVRHAYELLKPGGRLVAIMSTGPFQRSFKADQEFKAWTESVGAVVEDNEAGAFNGSDAFRQTGVNTVTVTIDKPEKMANADPVEVSGRDTAPSASEDSAPDLEPSEGAQKPATELKAYSVQSPGDGPSVLWNDEAIKQAIPGARISTPESEPDARMVRFPNGQAMLFRMGSVNEQTAHAQMQMEDPETGRIATITFVRGKVNADTIGHEVVHVLELSGMLPKSTVTALRTLSDRYGLTAQAARDYRDVPGYRREDGSVDTDKIHQEAVARLIAGAMSGATIVHSGRSIDLGALTKTPWYQRVAQWFQDLSAAFGMGEQSGERAVRQVARGDFGSSRADAVSVGEQRNGASLYSIPTKPADLLAGVDQDAAARMDQAMHVPKGTWLSRVVDAAKALKESFTRTYRHLDEKSDAEAVDILRGFEASMRSAGGRAARQIMEFTRDLTPDEYRTMGRILVLRDAVRQVQAGEFDEGTDSQGRTAAQILPTMQADLSKYETSASDRVKKAIEKRTEFNRQHAQRLVDAGLLDRAVLEEPDYLHRIVLSKLRDPAFAGLGNADKVRSRNRGFQKGRAGGTAADIPFYGENAGRDFLTDYVTAEWEYLAQGLQELARVEVQAQLKDRFDLSSRARQDAKARNQQAMDAWWTNQHTDPDGGVDQEAIDEGWDIGYRQRIAMNMEALQRLAKDMPNDGPFGHVVEAMQQGETAIPDWFPFLAHLASGDDENAARHARAIFKNIADRESEMKTTLGSKYQTWRDVARELTGDDSHALWQPKEGLQIVQGWSVQEDAITKALADAGLLSGQAEDDADLAALFPEALTIDTKGIKRQMVVVGRKPEWLIPAQLARQLDDMPVRDIGKTPIADALERGQQTWKRWILVRNPFRVIKYNINNLFGDLDVALTHPGVLKYSPAAAVDLARYLSGKELSADLERRMRAAEEHGLIDSGMNVAEIGDMRASDYVAALNGGVNWWQKSGGKFFRSVEQFTKWREAVLRLAAARYFHDQIKDGKRVYGASNAEALDTLYDLRQDRPSERAQRTADIAARLGNDLLGDYANISHGGKWMRRTLIPFYSWMEVNAPRYYRLIRNSAKEGGYGAAAGAATAGAVRATASMALKMSALTAASFMFNAMMKALLGISDDEDPNKNADLSKLIIITGRDADGKVTGIRVAGAMADALGWLDLANSPEKIDRLMKAERDGHLAAQAMATAGDALFAPVNRVAQSLNPILKEASAQATGRDIFPDARKPRPVRDRMDHLMGTFGLSAPYRAVTDRQGWGDTMTGSVMTTTDPRQQSTYRIRDDIEAWANQNGVALRSGGGEPTERSSALHQARSAFARGEDDRAIRWMQQYYELGGKPANLSSSKAGMHPLASLSLKDRKAYLDSLDEKGKAQLQRAISQWREFWDQPNEGFRSLAIRAWRERTKNDTSSK